MPCKLGWSKFVRIVSYVTRSPVVLAWDCYKHCFSYYWKEPSILNASELELIKLSACSTHWPFDYHLRVGSKQKETCTFCTSHSQHSGLMNGLAIFVLVKGVCVFFVTFCTRQPLGKCQGKPDLISNQWTGWFMNSVSQKEKAIFTSVIPKLCL